MRGDDKRGGPVERYLAPETAARMAAAAYGTLAPLADDEARGYEFINSLTGAQPGNDFGDDILAAHYRAVEHG